MKVEQVGHTIIAVLIIVGVFAMLVVSQITRTPLPAETITILSGSLGSALGWFFGARSAVAGSQMANQTAQSTAQTLAASALAETQSSHVAVEPAAAPATPQE